MVYGCECLIAFERSDVFKPIISFFLISFFIRLQNWLVSSEVNPVSILDQVLILIIIQEKDLTNTLNGTIRHSWMILFL